jgi:hypothetical protein
MVIHLLLFTQQFVMWAAQLIIMETLHIRQGWWTCGTCAQNGTQEDFFGMKHSLLSQLFILYPKESVYVLNNTCIYTRIRLHRDCMWIAFATKCYWEWHIFTQIGSGAKSWIDIYHWWAGLVVTEWIHDIGQKFLQSSFQTGSSSSPIYFQIFFLITILEEAFIGNIKLYYNMH